MTTRETNEFIDAVSRNDLTVRLHDKIYWCLGPAQYAGLGNKVCVSVFEADPVTHVNVRSMMSYESDSVDDCMKMFLEGRYWDGKTFYEVAPEMEWIDL